jgi:hypothetical protein
MCAALRVDFTRVRVIKNKNMRADLTRMWWLEKKQQNN